MTPCENGGYKNRPGSALASRHVILHASFDAASKAAGDGAVANPKSSIALLTSTPPKPPSTHSISAAVKLRTSEFGVIAPLPSRGFPL